MENQEKGERQRNNRKEPSTAPISQIDYNGIAKAIAGVLSAAPMTAAEKRARVQAIAKVLGTEPMTVREINAALGTDYEALQVANAVKTIPGAGACKVRRMTTNIRGEKVEREYTAYFLK